MKMGSGRRLSAAAVLIVVLYLGAAVETAAGTKWKSKVPALFIFGDSVVDAGNNNYITGFPLLPKSNIVPYGETYFHKPTGRWCNGRLIFDFIANYLSLPFPEPNLKPSSDPTRFKKGGNFASAGSGILDATFLWEGVINLSVQVRNYLKAVAELKKALGHEEAYKIIHESLFIFVTGNNDVSEYVSNTTLQQQYPADQYTTLMVSKLAADIQTVMDTGAQKIFIGGMGPIGCVPSALYAIGSTGPCLEVLNTLSRAVDAGLLAYVDKTNAKTKTKKVVLGTTYQAVSNITLNGTYLGFTKGSDACCGSGAYDGGSPHCGIGNYTLCTNVDQYAFWDFTHLTERAYHILADIIWSGDSSVSYPINIRDLAAL